MAARPFLILTRSLLPADPAMAPNCQVDQIDLREAHYTPIYEQKAAVEAVNEKPTPLEELGVPAAFAGAAIAAGVASSFLPYYYSACVWVVLAAGIALFFGQQDPNATPILESLKAFLATLNWLHVPLLLGTPVLAAYGVFTCDFNVKTYTWAFVWYYLTGLGITAGYHRYWAHRSYDARLPMQLMLLIMGTGALEGSIRWWSRDHRAHHRFVDTEKDPYSAKKGFFYSHMGWMLLKQDTKKIGRCDISDLNADLLVRWQHKHYSWFGPLCSFGIPTFVAGYFWGDWKGGFLIAGVLRQVMVHQSTFCINSIAHMIGDQPFADTHTPRDSWITALATMGEGYHNFHHEFPGDYRNAIKFFQYDPTKWLIRICSWVGLTYNLHTFPQNEVVKGRIQMEQKRLDAIKAHVKWAVDPAHLPEMSVAEFKKLSRSSENKEGKKALVVVEGIVHDVTDFVPTHPGGRAIMEPFIGKDVGAAFNGGVYDHSNAAHNLLGTFRTARLVGSL
eukprot:tig00000981_g5874.t1